MGGGDLQKMPVGIIMTRMPNIVTATLEENLLQVSHKIVEFEVDSLPVVKEAPGDQLEVIGRVTKTNLARVLVALGGQGQEGGAIW
jgi:DeoR family transcriptional regulator, catabolite repression regulator